MKNIKVESIINFTDMEENTHRTKGEQFLCTRERLEELLGDNPKKIVCVKVIEETDKPKKINTKKANK